MSAELENNYDGTFTLKSTHGRMAKPQPLRNMKPPKVKLISWVVNQAFKKQPAVHNA